MTVSLVALLYPAQENVFQARVCNIEKNIYMILKYLMDQSILSNEDLLEQKQIQKRIHSAII